MATTQRPLLFPFGSCIALSLAFMASGFPTEFRLEPNLDPESRMMVVVSIGWNHSRVAIHLAVINPASTTPVSIVCPLVMIKVTNIVTESTANSFQLMMVMLICFCFRADSQC